MAISSSPSPHPPAFLECVSEFHAQESEEVLAQNG